MNRWLGDDPFYKLLLLTERPGRWPWGRTFLFPLALAAVAGGLWGRAANDAALGGTIALGLVLWSLADGALLVSLPRRGVSFGPPQSPFLALSLLRWLLTLLVLPPGVRWPWPALAIWLAAQGAILALLAYGTLIEPFRLQITHLEVPLDRLANPGGSWRIVQLSDLHVERLTRRERALPDLVAGLKPDMIVLTGDLLNTTYNRDPRALADLGALLAQLDAPGGLYAVWGTPEVDVPPLLRPVLEKAGVTVLEDEAVEISLGGHPLWLMGLRCTHDLEEDEARLRGLLAAAPPKALTLLLYHTPDLMPRVAPLGVDLFLAGHTHGGQWRVPGFGALWTSSRYWKRYEGGHYRQGKTHLYVSRGIGLEGFGTPRARFFCPPEIVVVTLTGQGVE